MFGGCLDKFTSELPSSVKVSATGLLKRRRALALYSKNVFSNDAFNRRYVDGGSFIFVRPVAIRIPIPIRTITPTAIHIVGTLSRNAAMPSPRIRTMKPIRYVLNADIVLAC